MKTILGWYCLIVCSFFCTLILFSNKTKAHERFIAALVYIPVVLYVILTKW